MALDDLLRPARRRARRRAASSRIGAIEILGVLADDRDVERVAVLDEDLAVAVEEDAARRAQRQRALVVVLRHLLELRVLDDLEEPEADRQHGEHHDDAAPGARISRTAMRRRSSADRHCWSLRLQLPDLSEPTTSRAVTSSSFDRRPLRRRSTTPGSDSMIANATMPDHRVAERLTRNGRPGRRKLPQVEQHVEPHEHRRVQHRRRRRTSRTAAAPP